MTFRKNNLLSWFIVDGGLSGIAVFLCIAVGFGLMVLSLIVIDNQNLRIIGASFGLMIAAVGGYSARAKTLRLRPFGELSWREAKKSYEDVSQKREGEK